jgi:F0F1-type ATP synthase membrane subunit c/vacuolar-type H+-ATPase subunit K
MFFLLASLFVINSSAQIDAPGLGISVTLADAEVKDGDVVCSYPDGIKRCDKAYDPAMYGIVVSRPALYVQDTEMKDSHLVVSSGIATVNVTSVAGNIKEGSFVTSSTTAGVLQLADKNGYVLGSALEAYESSDSNSLGKIQVVVAIHPLSGVSTAKSNLIELLRKGTDISLLQPLESLRYLLAVVMVILSFGLGLIYFGRASRAGIEAIGRNPLARKMIQLSVFINIFLTMLIVLVGLGVAYIILIL